MKYLLLIVLTTALAFLVVTLPALESVARADFVTYWSAAHALATGKDPYNVEALTHIKREALQVDSEVEVAVTASWNPPWLLLLLLPLSSMPLQVASRVWLCASLVLVMLTVFVLRLLIGYQKRQPPIWLISSAAALWGGTLLTLIMGQVSILLLAGLVLTLYLLQEGKDWLVGPLLLLCAVKPHVTYLPLLLIYVWAFRKRRWLIFTSTLVAAGISFILSFIMCPEWFRSYLKLVTEHDFTRYSTSTLISWLHFSLNVDVPSYVSLLLLPILPLLLRTIAIEGWLTSLNMALLISLPLAPYGYSFDHIVLIPAIVQVISWLYTDDFPSLWRGLIAVTLLLIYGGWFWISIQPSVPYHRYAWFPVALSLCYLLAYLAKPKVLTATSPTVII